uniref:Protein arginine N-methyltransferase n=1 Tax=Compsopogon caeruleus TaxID=31354 RepID=A0A7S1TFA1_9RHOD|mmetsp:Transcript_3608/g.6845  ORF Transcript_3608/g.6845 Transcript_3608/m.6845 type:complete len:640 (+) Transcript_3608:407-2326(+)
MVVTHPTTGEQLSIGIDVVSVPRLRTALENAEQCGCDFIMAPLVHPRYERVFTQGQSWCHEGSALVRVSSAASDNGCAAIVRDEPLTRSDLELSSSEWMSGVIGKVSPWIRLESPNDYFRENSEMAFRQEISLASHLSLRAIIINAPTSGSAANFSRSMNSALSSLRHVQMWIRIPATYPAVNGKSDIRDPWDVWNTIRNMCDSHPNLGIVLEIGENLPAKNELERWIAEPVKILAVSTNAFVLNKVGYPVLLKKHQDFVKIMFKYGMLFAITGRGSSARLRGAEGYRQCVQYIAHLFGKQPPSTESEAFEAPFRDYLQAPLQPLADDLESQTYETFEKDPVKYQKYREAIALYLSEKVGSSDRIVVMVLGAGRGPLVKAALAASADTQVPIDVFAVEKNPNAVVTLENLRLENEWSNVSVIHCDMRHWEAPARADLVVSELLGSFGDNELSPECLDGATKYLKPDAVSIPQSYASFLAPLASTKLHNEVRAYGDTQQNFETPYVVSIHRGRILAEPQEVFRFSHPNRSPHPDNTRFKTLEFKILEANMVHGLAGYFEAQLYMDVVISINPPTATTGMFSWFPFYIPIRNPVYVPKESTCQVQMWRKASPGRVWYEWAVTRPAITPVHNPNGRSYWMGL